MKRAALFLVAAILVALPLMGRASFHFMQIEQVIGGVNGDASQQAIQLRMRAGGQNLVSGTSLVAYDAAGANPITLLQFPANVGNSAAGARILVVSPDFALQFGAAGDAQMTAEIPPGYLAAGRLTFGFGATIYWSLCWGGMNYTGATSGSNTNDANGDFGPCIADGLPSNSDTAIAFQGAAAALSTTNLADYALSPSPATFTNNQGGEVTLEIIGIFADGFED